MYITGLQSQNSIPTKGLRGSRFYLKQKGNRLQEHCYLEWRVINVWRKKTPTKQNQRNPPPKKSQKTQKHFVKDKKLVLPWLPKPTYFRSKNQSLKSKLTTQIQCVETGTKSFVIVCQNLHLWQQQSFPLPLPQVKWIWWYVDLPHLLQGWG